MRESTSDQQGQERIIVSCLYLFYLLSLSFFLGVFTLSVDLFPVDCSPNAYVLYSKSPHAYLTWTVIVRERSGVSFSHRWMSSPRHQ